MKKTLSLIAAVIITGFTSTSAQAEGQYISGMGGASWIQNLQIKSTYSNENYTDNYKLETGFSLLGAIGCNHGNYRIEGELGYQRSNLKSLVYSGFDEYGAPYSDTSYNMNGDVSVVSIMANGYYDIPLANNIKLYATAGIGGAQVSFENIAQTNQNYSYSIKETTIAYQIGAGFTKPIAQNVSLDVRYRYFATPDFTVNWDYKGKDYSNNTHISNHSLLLGMRVSL